MKTIQDLLKQAVAEGASDLHLTTGVAPVLRIDGELQSVDEYGRMTPDRIRQLVEEITAPEQLETAETEGEVDFSYGLAGVGRFRCSLYKQRGTLSIAIRIIAPEVPSIEELGLPEVVHALPNRKDGLVLVTGPTGSGKSTTLAAIIDRINETRPGVIITLEDPTEYLHRHKKCIVNQREVGTDTKSFAKGLRAALREDPDVILVGEMRDLETISTAIRAAETGHLVLSTLHTRGAAQSIDRIVDAFPPHNQQQVKVQLAATLEAVISQQLLPRSHGKGRVLATEVLVGTPAVRNLIREGKTHQLQSLMETGNRYGMHTFAASLRKLASAGLVDEAEVRRVLDDVF